MIVEPAFGNTDRSIFGPLAQSGGAYLHLMQVAGLIMTGLFFYLFFVPYRVLDHEVNEGNFPAAGVAMARIRMIIGINLILGLITVFVGASKLF